MTGEYEFTFKLMCRSCETPKILRMVPYPFPIGSLLPTSYGKDACCIKCGRAELEILNTPSAPEVPKKPLGWVSDPREKK